MTYAALAGEPPRPGWYVVPYLEPAKYVGKKGTKGEFEMTLRSRVVPTRKGYLNGPVREVLKEAGYYQQLEGGHTFRRSGAIALYNQLSEVGHDRAIRICQAMLGHASIQTTEIYLRLDLDRKVRNDLLAGKPMFPQREPAKIVVLGSTIPTEVVDIGRSASGEGNARAD